MTLIEVGFLEATDKCSVDAKLYIKKTTQNNTVNGDNFDSISICT